MLRELVRELLITTVTRLNQHIISQKRQQFFPKLDGYSLFEIALGL